LGDFRSMEKQEIDAELLWTTINNLVDGFFTINDHGIIQSTNLAGEKLFGYSFDEMVGKNINMLMPEPDHSLHNQYIENYLNTGNAKIIGKGREVMGKRKNGTTFPLELSVNEVETPDGKLFAGILRDITIKKEEEKRKAQHLALIMEMSTPVLKLWEQVLLLPIVGMVDSKRVQMIMETALQKILDHQAKVVIVDVQGVPAVDSAVANHLIKVAKATKLMGCTSIITGISPEVSQSLVNLGIELTDILTRSTLKEGVSTAFDQLNFQLRKRS